MGILWLFCSAGCVGLYPLWEGRLSMAHTFRGIVRDLQGKGRKRYHHQEGELVEVDVGSGSGSVSPSEKGGGGEGGEKRIEGNVVEDEDEKKR